MTELGETITVTCACGAKLNAPLSAVGKTAPCPKCRAPLTVPRPDEADFGVAPEQFDYSMGKGVRYACIAGAIAAAISTGLAVAVEGEIGIAAVGIGFACGLAMLAGTKRRAPEVGIITAGITAGAILLSKIAIFMALVLGTASAKSTPIEDAQREHDQKVEALVAEALPADDDAEDAEDVTAAVPTTAAPAVAAPAEEEGSSSGLGVLAFLLMMFGMYDIIFFAGAMAAAYFVSTYNDT